jgi:hypothetical protein
MRQEREAADRVALRRRQRQHAMEGARLLGGGHPTRSALLRILLLPALAVFALTRVGPGLRPARAAEVRRLSPGVLVDGGELESPTAVVGKSARVETRASGVALLACARAMVRIEPSTRLWIEDGSRSRIRIHQGSLGIAGSGTVTSELGVVLVEEGRAKIRLSGAELVVTAEAGQVRLLDGRGDVILRPGSVRTLER